MKITNVKVDVFKWQVEPWRVGAGMRFGGPRQLGIVTVETDEGISGNAFLSGPNHHAQPLIDVVKPRVMGRNPQDIGAIWPGTCGSMNALSLHIGAIGADRHLPLGHQRQDSRSAHSPSSRHLQGVRARLLLHCLLGDEGRVPVEEALRFQDMTAGPLTRFTRTRQPEV